MLTEIEWWGGILFIWFVICYKMVCGEQEKKLSVDFFAFNFSFISSAAVLALYFYPLETPVLKQIYLILLIIALFSTLLMLFWPESEQESSDKDDEEIGLFYEILGQSIFFFPVFASFGLGVYKSRHIVDALGIFS